MRLHYILGALLLIGLLGKQANAQSTGGPSDSTDTVVDSSTLDDQDSSTPNDQDSSSVGSETSTESAPATTTQAYPSLDNTLNIVRIVNLTAVDFMELETNFTTAVASIVEKALPPPPTIQPPPATTAESSTEPSADSTTEPPAVVSTGSSVDSSTGSSVDSSTGSSVDSSPESLPDASSASPGGAAVGLFRFRRELVDSSTYSPADATSLEATEAPVSSTEAQEESTTGEAVTVPPAHNVVTVVNATTEYTSNGVTDLFIEYYVENHGVRVPAADVDRDIYNGRNELATALGKTVVVVGNVQAPTDTAKLSQIQFAGLTEADFKLNEMSFRDAIATSLNQASTQVRRIIRATTTVYSGEDVYISNTEEIDGSLKVTYYIATPDGTVVERSVVDAAVKADAANIAQSVGKTEDDVTVIEVPSDDTSNAGLEPWAIALIVIACAVVLIIIIAVGVKMTNKNKGKSSGGLASSNSHNYQTVQNRDSGAYNENVYQNPSFDGHHSSSPSRKSKQEEGGYSSQL